MQFAAAYGSSLDLRLCASALRAEYEACNEHCANCAHVGADAFHFATVGALNVALSKKERHYFLEFAEEWHRAQKKAHPDVIYRKEFSRFWS